MGGQQKPTIRFAFVSTMNGAAWGGSEVLWSEAALRLARAGHRVYASVSYWPHPREALGKLRAAGVEVWERPASAVPLWLNVLKNAGLALSDRLARRPMRRWLASTSANLVCISNGDVASGADWLAECQDLGLRHANLAQANHEQWWCSDDQTSTLRRIFSAAHACFFVSEGNLKLFEKQLAQRLPNAEIVRNPFNVSWDAQCAWPEGPPDVWKLASVGRLEPYAKGQDLLIDVLSRPEWRDRSLSISIYGQGQWEQTLSRLAQLHEVGDRVRFCGHVEDVEKIWSTHHALILPSRFEGLPLVLVEAMLCGRPVIATDVAGHGELIDEGVTGFLADAPTTPLVAAAMERAWIRRDDWRSMGEEASRRVRTRVPQDPAAVFMSRLLTLAGGGQTA
jgi:glycosyltransferase involved in cell wall biosynthesis